MRHVHVRMAEVIEMDKFVVFGHVLPRTVVVVGSRRIVAFGRVLHHLVGSVDTEAVNSTVQPETSHIHH